MSGLGTGGLGTGTLGDPLQGVDTTEGGTFGSGNFGTGNFGNLLQTDIFVSPPTTDIFLYRFGDTTKYRLSGVGRSISVSEEKLGKSGQLKNGSTVRDIINIKKTIDISWEWLPHLDNMTKDGGIGFRTFLNQLYEYSGDGGRLTIDLPNGTGGFVSYNVYIDQSSTAEMNRIYTGLYSPWQAYILNATPAGTNYIRVSPTLFIQPGNEFIVQDGQGNTDTYTVSSTVTVGSETKIFITDITVRDYIGNESVQESGSSVTSGRNIFWNVQIHLVEV